MTEQHLIDDTTNTMRANLHIVVIGCGPVGIRFVKELLQRQPNARITLFGNEPYRPYNRVQLSSLLAGDVSLDDIELSLPGVDDYPGFVYRLQHIAHIDTQLKRVTDKVGHQVNYDRLILATGARPHVPNIAGMEQTGVYTFRNLRDAEYLYARTSRAQHIVIAGGGLLGIEAARALLKNNTEITLVQQGTHLMNKQLDEPAANLLQQCMEELNIRVITNTSVRKITGSGRVTGVMLRSKELIECDTVLFCSGITPNIEIARSAHLRVNRGILVNDQLQTENPYIYAIGECCEHQGLTYGIVNPGYEQAAILADLLTGGEAQYLGSLQASQLKVMDRPVRSMGDVVNYTKTPFHREWVYRGQDKYRKLTLHKNQVVGAVSVGEWGEASRVQEAFQQQRKLIFWQPWLFKFTGRLWPNAESTDITQWSADTIVCQCNGIKQGTLVTAIQQGCDSVKSVSKCTQAGTVCGSCKPLLQQMVSTLADSKHNVKPEKEWAWAPMLLASFMAIVVALSIVVIPGIAVGESVNEPAPFEFLWNDKFWKQVTGFSLLGMSVVGLLMSLRKRIKSDRIGKFAYWRFFHIVLGALCAVTLLAHTGLHTGDNLNQMLMIDFLTVLVMGAIASSVVALGHRLPPMRSQRVKKFWSWAHILVTWPLPILLGTHILTVYYY